MAKNAGRLNRAGTGKGRRLKIGTAATGWSKANKGGRKTLLKIPKFKHAAARGAAGNKGGGRRKRY
jgi:hypothetical protein